MPTNQNTRKKNQTDTVNLSDLSHTGKLGNGTLLGKPVASSFPWDRIEKQIENRKIDMPINTLANDNSVRRVLSQVRTFCFVLGAFVFGILAGTHSDTLATQAILHADEAVLNTVMDTSPQTLAYMLNEINVGE